MRNLDDRKRSVTELSIQLSAEQFLQDSAGEPNKHTSQIITWVDSYADKTDAAVKILCEVVDDKCRLIQSHKDKKVDTDWNHIPVGTTHLFYNEFISQDRICSDYTIDRNLIIVPLKIIDGVMHCYKSSLCDWVIAHNGNHVLDAISYHELEWIKNDFVNPRLRTLPIVYQLIDYFDQIYYYHNDLEFELSNLRQSLFDLFHRHLIQYAPILCDLVKDKNDMFNIINIIEKSAASNEDPDYKEFAEFVVSYKKVFNYIITTINHADFIIVE